MSEHETSPNSVQSPKGIEDTAKAVASVFRDAAASLREKNSAGTDKNQLQNLEVENNQNENSLFKYTIENIADSGLGDLDSVKNQLSSAIENSDIDLTEENSKLVRLNNFLNLETDDNDEKRYLEERKRSVLRHVVGAELSTAENKLANMRLRSTIGMRNSFRDETYREDAAGNKVVLKSRQKFNSIDDAKASTEIYDTTKEESERNTIGWRAETGRNQEEFIIDYIVNGPWESTNTEFESESETSDEEMIEKNEEIRKVDAVKEEKEPLSELTGWARAKYYLDNPGVAVDRMVEKSKAAYYGFIPGVQEKLSNASKETKDNKGLITTLLLGGVAVAFLYDYKYGTDTAGTVAESVSEIPADGIDFSNPDAMGIVGDGLQTGSEVQVGADQIASTHDATTGTVESATETVEATSFVPLEVEPKHGFTHEIRDIAVENNIIGLDGDDYMEVYKELETKLIAEIPSYLMDSGNYGISSPGTHAITGELYNEVVDTLKEKALNK